MCQHQRRSVRPGFTLVEIIIALAILAVMAGAIVTTVLNKVAESRAQRATQELSTIHTGVASWIQRTGATTFTGLSMNALATNGAVPSSLASASVNPFGGDYLASGTQSTFTLSVTQVPDAKAAQAIQAVFRNRATVTLPAAYPGTVSITFSES